ncbi:MAG: selenocysteine-specific translation elongation factor [Acidimicrobiales bacterium]
MSDATTHHVVATAGHVDHGKSTLVRALTGTDPDRLAEERERGLTIDLGFAWCRLPSGRDVAVVDVPGHVRFLRNMLAGVGAVDACVFVVAATEGWKPQSEEHLRILEVLGHRHGLVVLSMAGLVDADDLELARLEVAEAVAGTFLDDAPIVAVDAVDGRGLADLRLALDRMLGDTPEAPDRGRPRLWIDRSFAPRGAGTVVTGTLTGGSLAVDDELLVEPSGRTVRVRGLQSEEQAADRLGPGRRVAVNLSGVSHHEVARGDALVRGGQWHRTQHLDARLDVLAALDHAVSRRGAYLAYFGSGEQAVSLRVLGPERLEPGSTGFVRLHLPVPLPLLPGDRFVLRESGRQETVGGGEVLDVDPRAPAARARPDADVDALIARRGWIEADELERLTGERRPATVGRWVVDPSVLSGEAERIRAAVAAAGPTGLDVATFDERDRAVLDHLDDVQQAGGRATSGSTGDPYAAHPYLDVLRAEPFHPPTPTEAGVSRAEVRELVRRGHVIEHKGVCFSTDAVAEAAARLVPLLDANPDGVTVGDVREVLDASRKYVVPLLEVLDATGRTRRRGDRRIAGPRLLDG